MPIVVRAVPESEYKKWVAKQKGEAVDPAEAAAKTWTMKTLMAKGKEVYMSTCAACHKPTGEGAPPVFPALKGAKITTTKSELAHNMHTVIYGRKGTAMQAFGKQFDIVELAGVLTYVRNAWGNNTGDVVQPAAVYKMQQEDNK